MVSDELSVGWRKSAFQEVFVFGLAAGQLVYGPLFDRYGRRTPLLIGIALFAAGALMAAVAPTIEVLLAARLLQAVGAAAGVVAPRAVISDLFDTQEAAAVYSVLGQIQMMAAPVAAPLLGALILQWSGWRTSFWLLLVITLILWVASHRVVPDSLLARRRSALSFGSVARAYASLLRNVPYMVYTAAGTLLFGTLFTYISVSPFVLMTEFGASSIQFGLIFGSITVLIVMSGALNIRLLPSRGPETLLLAGLGAHSLAGLALRLLSFTQAGMWAFVSGNSWHEESGQVIMPVAIAHR